MGTSPTGGFEVCQSDEGGPCSTANDCFNQDTCQGGHCCQGQGSTCYVAGDCCSGSCGVNQHCN
jgi:hypothetical protein